MVTVARSHQCEATCRATGERCNRRAIIGGKVCVVHGGSLPVVKKAAGKGLAHQKAAKALARFAREGIAVPAVKDPLAALEQLAGDAWALKERLRLDVEELETIRYQSDQGLEQMRSEVVAYQSAILALERVLSRIVSLNIDERRLRLEEAKAVAFITSLGRVLKRIGMDDETQRRLKEMLAKDLRDSVEVVPELPAVAMEAVVTDG